MSELFNRNRIIAFVLILVAGILGWLGLILSSIAWIRNCLTIRPYKK